mmetsp:Transcript_21580/g.42714  ORF Transcript_21580/g.42714 Transcript_21580/m.42714 type:complete len:121 (+) Transcript_21580:165-527(+)
MLPDLFSTYSPFSVIPWILLLRSVVVRDVLLLCASLRRHHHTESCAVSWKGEQSSTITASGLRAPLAALAFAITRRKLKYLLFGEAPCLMYWAVALFSSIKKWILFQRVPREPSFQDLLS